MGLHLFGFQERLHEVAITKSDFPVKDCVFLLDFSRPLKRVRWFGIVNRWLGITIGLHVPVAHLSEQSGGYTIGIRRGEPYFANLQELWVTHQGSTRTLVTSPVDGLEIVADFGRHFSEDCQ